jgi:hypothetical protein
LQERASELVSSGQGEEDDDDNGFSRTWDYASDCGKNLAWSKAWAWAQLNCVSDFPLMFESLTPEQERAIEEFLYPPSDDVWAPGTWGQAIAAARAESEAVPQ